MGRAVRFALATVKPHLEETGLGGKGSRENRAELKQVGMVGGCLDADPTPTSTPTPILYTCFLRLLVCLVKAGLLCSRNCRKDKRYKGAMDSLIIKRVEPHDLKTDMVLINCGHYCAALGSEYMLLHLLMLLPCYSFHSGIMGMHSRALYALGHYYATEPHS